MNSTKTTVQALLNVLVGRDPNEVIMIENNQLRVVSTVNLLEQPAPRLQLQTKLDHLYPAGVLAMTNSVAKQLKSTIKVENSKRSWKSSQLKTLQELRNSGASFEALAEVFGRTPKAIQIQLSKLRNPKPNQKVGNSVALL